MDSEINLGLKTSSQFIKQLNAFRHLVSSDIKPIQMTIFLEVATSSSSQVTPNYIQSKYGITQSSASRNCRALTCRASPHRDGYNLCQWAFVESDHRYKFLELTEHGKNVANELKMLFN